MFRYICFIIGLLFSSAAFGTTCKVSQQFTVDDQTHVTVIDQSQVNDVKAGLLNAESAYIDYIEGWLGKGSAEAIVQNRYPSYLTAIGCGEHVTNERADPLTHSLKMRSVDLPRSRLKHMCKSAFPKGKPKEEIWVAKDGLFLRYRGKECAAFAF